VIIIIPCDNTSIYEINISNDKKYVLKIISTIFWEYEKREVKKMKTKLGQIDHLFFVDHRPYSHSSQSPQYASNRAGRRDLKY